ncbi:MAG: HD domain-containing protein [Bacteroidales bacterium]|nr:HD domain-containing protein [Bacteroidales bacterium]
MKKYKQNKIKIVNDPLYGLINIPSELIFDIIQHPYFQRLRRIHQLGLTAYVYPGATHTRFQHVLGATYLMKQALQVIQSKGTEITKKEIEAALLAILLHDIGHPPLSHSLEYILVENISHEVISLLFMEEFNKQFAGKLTEGIEVFKGEHKKKFLHQLVSSQLDMDRLDYLRRDSFFTGVSEGVVGYDRIIKMLNVFNNELVVDEKGIYSVEKFLIARRLMYWQVYLHKTVVVAEQLLIKVLLRAKQIYTESKSLFLTPVLEYFFKTKINSKELMLKKNNGYVPLHMYAQLDDNDIFVSIKEWQNHDDFVLSYLSKSIVNRNLLKIELTESFVDKNRFDEIKQKVMKKYNISDIDANYLVFTDSIKNNAYSDKPGETINILKKNNELKDIALASDVSNVAVLSKIVEKFYLCYPKEIQAI